MREIERQVLLGVIDHAWREHLHAMDHLRDATRFRGYAQKDPLQEYKKEGFVLFGATLEKVALETAQRILHIDPDFLLRQQEAMRRAREMEIRMRQAMQFSAPGEPGTQPVVEGAPAAPPRPMAGPLPGTVVQPGPGVRMPPGFPQQPAFKDVGRNDPCPCGSGKKFKKCHGSEA
jgi:preprotein translocase subunit SecA